MMTAARTDRGRRRRALAMSLVLAALATAACDGGEAPQRGAQPAVAVAPAAGGTALVAMFGHDGDAPVLTEADRRQVRAAEIRAYAVAAGQPVHWQNPSSGIFGEIVPTGAARQQGREVCRTFRHMVMVEGRRFEAQGPACEPAAAAIAKRQ